MVVWNLSDIYNPKYIEKLKKELEQEISHFEKHREKLTPSLLPEEFMGYIIELEKIDLLASRLATYSQLKLSENHSDADALAQESKMSNWMAPLMNKLIFFSLWFQRISDEQAEKYITHSGDYRYALQKMRLLKDYSLSEPEEKIISIKDTTGASALVNLYEMYCNNFKFIMDGKEMTREQVARLCYSPKQSIRKKAYTVILEKAKKESALIGEIYRNLVMDVRNESINLRKFKTPIEIRNKSHDLPNEVVSSLLDSVRENRKLFQKYFKLKGKILKLKHMTRFDVYAPYLVKEKKFTFEQTKKEVFETFRSFSPKFEELAKKVFDENHVHSDIQHGKTDGAFCSTVSKEITPYVLLNFTGRSRDVETMAHELGHAIHSMLAAHNTEFTQHPVLPMAETASLFGEMILSDKLMKKASKKEKTAILMRRLDGLFAAILRQAYFTIFEVKVHELIAKGATIDEMNKAFYDTVLEQFGASVEHDPLFSYEWYYVSYMFSPVFYSYAYAFGNLLVLSLYKMYEQEGESFVPKYLEILSKGSSASPSDILKAVGIDISKKSFWQSGFDIIKEKVDELEKLTS